MGAVIRMLSAFDLRPGVDWSDFRLSYAAFLEELRAADLILSAGQPGTRVRDTPMDTDDARTHQCFSVMEFRDREQMDRAYAHIEARLKPGTDCHIRMYRQITNSVFLCWHEDDLEKGATT